jgi:PhzF family phenazine biosynthesis protein
MLVDVHIVNAFIDGETGGNPAAVVLDANGLSAAQKLQIAAHVGLSETAFVSSSAIATIKLEFFTPTRQIAHCGHATIATFSLLRQLGKIGAGWFSKETIDGNRDILLKGAMAFMEQRAPSYQRLAADSIMANRIATSLGIQALSADPFVVNTGNAFLLIAVPDEQALAQLQPQFELIETLSNELDLIGYYAFSRRTKLPARHASTRMFAPRYGIAEEAGTGMAAGPLACFLHDQLGVNEHQIVIEQGWHMQPASPSVIEVMLELEGGKISRLMAGGTARIMSNMRVTV